MIVPKVYITSIKKRASESTSKAPFITLNAILYRLGILSICPG